MQQHSDETDSFMKFNITPGFPVLCIAAAFLYSIRYDPDGHQQSGCAIVVAARTAGR